ncbi:SDR family NAD(P)-dependent oxidoreductase [Streptomyces sp. NBC_00344]|uniref:SDR family NAD(P)-dependent oxidoreductase n=1 Tax=Streptomyces sp. NBC_00344 TaxID=2975720 RepID=UPI002E22CB60
MTPITEQNVLITGATDGLGRALAHELAAQGATLILHGRSAAKGEELIEELRSATGNDRLSYELADFSSLEEIRGLADRIVATYPRLDVLVNNAGLGVELERQVSKDGHELTFQVDYLAPYILSCRLAGLLAESAPARIVNVTSAGQAPLDFDDVMLERDWDGGQAYCQAKLAEIMLTIDLAEQLEGTGVTVNALHPSSYMPTKIVVHLFSPQSTVAEGVEHTLRLVTGTELSDVTGAYFNRSTRARAHAQAYDPAARARLREISEDLTGVVFSG